MDKRERGTTFGVLLRAHRLRAELTQEKLAAATGLSLAMIRSVEQGRTRFPRAGAVGKLAMVLGLSAAEEAELRRAANRRPDGGGEPCEAAAGPLEVLVLGPLEVRRGGVPVPLGEPKQRAVLGLLALSPNVTVHRETIIDALWEDTPPSTAVNLVQSYVSKLRRLLDPGHNPGDQAGLLVSARTSYRLQLATGQADVLQFGQLVTDAQASAARGDQGGACDLYERALGLWRAVPLCDIDILRGRPAVKALGDRHAETVTNYAKAACAAGEPVRALGHLRVVAAQETLNEAVHAWLMIVLAGTGQQGAALAVFKEVRQRLHDELGMDPGPELTAAQRSVLRQELPVAAAGITVVARAPRVTPRQLPGAVAHFTGREAEIGELDRIEEAARAAGTVAIGLIGGTAGVGKTELAIHWAHQAAGRFPDGQLYVNLRGYDAGQPVAAPEALAGFLRALGMPGPDVPADPDERAASYRSLVAGRRLLIVADNARSAEQVRPLLPGAPTCMVVVTSRDSLAGLAARDGATRVDLDPLPLADAAGLLSTLIGRRAGADPAAARALAQLCCRLPLPLRVAAELAVNHPGEHLAEMVAELSDQQRRLDLLDLGGDRHSAVRAVFSWSYRHLDAAAARVFRLLALHPGLDADAHAAAALAGDTVANAGPLLDVLARAHLVQATPQPRYSMHDLLRAYARELGTTLDTSPERREALTRLFDYYLHTASAAMDALAPDDWPRRPRLEPADWPFLPSVTTQVQARAWLDKERPNLVAVTAHAAQHGWPGYAAQLAATVARYMESGGHVSEAVTVHTHAISAAHSADDWSGEAAALASLGVMNVRQGDCQRAITHLLRALTLCHDMGDEVGEARARTNLGLTCFQIGEYQEAAGHHHQALELHGRRSDRTGQARALNNLGLVEERMGRFPVAIDYFERSLALFREVSNQVSEVFPLGNLGWAYRAQGRWDEAVGCLEQALKLCRTFGILPGEADALGCLGDVYLAQDAEEQALPRYREALALFTQACDQPGQAQVRNGMGEALLATGRAAQARAEHEAALDLARRIGDRYEQARAHNGLAHCHGEQAQGVSAHWHLQQALTLYSQLGLPQVGRARLTTGPSSGQAGED